MIRTLEELIDWTEELSMKVPLLREETLITRPGCSKEEILALQKALPSIPPHFLAVNAQINLNRVSLLHFRFSPEIYEGDTLVKQMISCNTPEENPYYEEFQKHKVYCFGHWERDFLGVVYEDGMYQREEIVLYDIEDRAKEPKVIGQRYDQFLFLVGNINQAFEKAQQTGDGKRVMEEFEEVYRELCPSASPKMAELWKGIAEVYLLD